MVMDDDAIYINDNDLWTVSWFTTNKQVVVHIMTTIVRILAYSDATLFDVFGNSFAENPRTIFFAKFIAYFPRLGLNIANGLEFSAKPLAKRSHHWNLYDRLLMLRKKNKVSFVVIRKISFPAPGN